MAPSTPIVLSLAAGAIAGVANVCVQPPFNLMQEFRDYEPAKSYCAPHFPAQTVTKTLPPRCLTTTSTVILGTSTVTTTSNEACPTADVLQKRDSEIEERQWGGGGWGGSWGGQGGRSGGWGGPENGWGEGWGASGWYGWDHGDNNYWGGSQPWWKDSNWWGGWGWGGEHNGGWGWGWGGQPHKPASKPPPKPTHAGHCENHGDCGQGEHCYHENKHWWHDSHDHWWCGGPDHPWQGGWGGGSSDKGGDWGTHNSWGGGWKRDAAPSPAENADIEERWGSGGGWGWGHGPGWWHRPSGGQCVPPKHHHHPRQPPPPPPPPPPYHHTTKTHHHTTSSSSIESGYPLPTYNVVKPAPKPHWKREALATMSAGWANYQADLVKCGYDCIQTACSCVAATKTEHHTPTPTCTETKTKETLVHITTTIAGEPRDCNHGDLRKKS